VAFPKLGLLGEVGEKRNGLPIVDESEAHKPSLLLLS
jgi:hypothetical protein